MDAVDFLKTIRRICNSNKNGYNSCVVYQNYNYCHLQCVAHPEEIVDAVEKWAKEHPIKTRQSEFLKNYPYAPFYPGEDWLPLCPRSIDHRLTCPRGKTIPTGTECTCDECKENYWLAEVD